MKVFIGCHNLANMMSIYKKGFQEIGAEVDCYIQSEHPFYQEKFIQLDKTIDVSIQIINSYLMKNSRQSFYDDPVLLKQLEPVIQKYLDYDIYIFLNCMSLLPGNLDYPILKSKDKIIISLFSGSEVRDDTSAKDIWKDLGTQLTIRNQRKLFSGLYYDIFNLYNSSTYGPSLSRKRLNTLMAELYADLILSVPEQSSVQLAPYHPYIHGIHNDQCSAKIPNRKVPKIIHIPSSPEIKGTKLIISIMEELKAEGLKFNFEVQSKIPHNKVLKLLTDADILVDEFNFFPGLLSHEGLASGCAVLTGNHPFGLPIPLKKYQCPAIHISPSNLKEEMKKVILDRELRNTLATQGISYVNDYASPKACVTRLISYLERSSNKDYDYYPKYAFEKLKYDNQDYSFPFLQNLTFKVLKRHGVYSKYLIPRMITAHLLPQETSFNDFEEWHYNIQNLSKWVQVNPSSL